LVLSKYGIPEALINMPKKMYMSCSVQIQVSKEEVHVEYGMGVQQDNNMASISFLFVMQAAMETFESKQDNDIEFRYFEEEKKGETTMREVSRSRQEEQRKNLESQQPTLY
jgi:hypothetical protein